MNEPVTASGRQAAWWQAGWRLGLGLSLTPVVVAISLRVLPRLNAAAAVASFVSFAGAAGSALAALALAVPARVRARVALAVAGLALSALAVIAHRQPSSDAAVVAVDTALIALAWALGASLGQRVQHASHLVPACVVAACADVVSLLSPEGPSHAVAESERALSVAAIWFPVPGSRAVSPALGVGDLLFIAFVLGVASAHHLSYARAIACCAVGVAAAGFGAACLEMPFPALVPIAAAIVVGLPGIRPLRAVDRRAAHWSMWIAASLALASVARSAVAR